MSAQPTPHIAVGAIVVKDHRLLMVQRAKDPGDGLWSIPGGNVEHGEYLAAAVKREVKEETGLDVEVGEVAGIFEVVGDPHYVILDFVATFEGSDEPRAAQDVSDARWVSREELEELECTPRLAEMLRAWNVF